MTTSTSPKHWLILLVLFWVCGCSRSAATKSDFPVSQTNAIPSPPLPIVHVFKNSTVGVAVTHIDMTETPISQFLEIYAKSGNIEITNPGNRIRLQGQVTLRAQYTNESQLPTLMKEALRSQAGIIIDSLDEKHSSLRWDPLFKSKSDALGAGSLIGSVDMAEIDPDNETESAHSIP